MQIIPIADEFSQSFAVTLGKQNCQIRLYQKSAPVIPYPQNTLLVSNSGVAQAGAPSTLTLADGADTSLDFYKGQQVLITGNTGVGQKQTITGSQTNLVPYSQELEKSTWAKSSVVVSGYTNVAVAPDGTLTADKIAESSIANINHTLHYSRTTASNETMTVSAYLKAGERVQASLQLSDFVLYSSLARFDLVAGKILNVSTPNADYTNISATIADAGNEWFRCSLTSTKLSYNTRNDPSLTPNLSGAYAYVGTVGYGFYAWGVQLEQGSVMSKYTHTAANPAVGIACATPWEIVPDKTSNYVVGLFLKNSILPNKPEAVYCDVLLDNELIVGGVVCENLNRIIRSTYLGFKGDLFFQDTQGTSDPTSPGLGSRYQFCYLEPSDVI